MKHGHWPKGDEIAVLGCMIRLGNCLDLLDPQNAETMRSIHREYAESCLLTGIEPKKNGNHRKFLDCAVFEFAYTQWDVSGYDIDTARAVYVPTESKQRLWTRIWLMAQTHIQLCVRNPRLILGTWLVSPEKKA